MQSLQQHINAIAEQFYRLGGDTAIICPGSRDVPLIVAFSRHPKINCIPVIDERSAAFIALGISQQSHKPVAIICTSGTAALNFYPAICEAFYQNIPLIVITADRPPELIDQWDGQAIRQEGVFQNHILKQITIPHLLQESSMGTIKAMVADIISLGVQQSLPVHINVPFREPFYPSESETYEYELTPISHPIAQVLTAHYSTYDSSDIASIRSRMEELFNKNHALKVLVLIGANQYGEKVWEAIKTLQERKQIPVIADIISNYKYSDIQNYDFVIDAKNNRSDLAPELIISIGGPMLSKNLKQFLRNNPPQMHVHVQAVGHVGNPFGSLSSVLRCEPELFFQSLHEGNISSDAYKIAWESASFKYNISNSIEALPYCELKAAYHIFNALPLNSHLQLSNSMPVRYGLIFGVHQSIQVNANRGTSGIDGCSSTAVGAATTFNGSTTLITGDLAFFYDSNAFWNSISLKQFRIIVFNNGGGGIFRIIDGPSKLIELDSLIEQAHQRDAKHIASDFNMQYFSASKEDELIDCLNTFFDDAPQTKILEVFSNSENNAKIYHQFKNLVRENAIS